MASEQTLYVQVARLNVRRAPRVLADNIVDVLSSGDPIQVLEQAEVTPDGWVWRRLVESDEHWIAEFNQHTGVRLLDVNLPELAEIPKDAQMLFVVTGGVKVRSAPRIAPDNAVGFLAQGKSVSVEPGVRQVGPSGWVWRRVTGQEDKWIAEYNCRTGMRLLGSEPLVEQPDPAAAVISVAEHALPLVGGRVRLEGREFLLDGRPFRFLGVNLREFAFYPRQDVLPFATAVHQEEQLKAALRMKMRVVRLHACHHKVSLGDTVPLLRDALDLLHDHGMLAIVVLNDALGASGYYVPGDERFHRHEMGHLDKVDYFVKRGFEENFLPFIQKLVPLFSDHPAIFAWELGNEYAIIPQPASVEESEAFLHFARVSSDAIRALDSNHLITTGLVNTGHVAPTGHDRAAYAKRLYGLPALDFATVHFYEDNSEEHSSLLDFEVMKQLNKPLIVEEFGATGDNRAAFSRSRLEDWFVKREVAGFMQWGLSATPVDIGVGDNMRGMDPYSERNRAHYEAMVELYRQWAEKL